VAVDVEDTMTETNTPNTIPDEARLSSAQVRKLLVPVSCMSLWRWRKTLGFPEPVKINGRNYWKAGEVRAWLAQRQATEAA
jgi:predicted DNA-binding transcriptional regulator AlpA